MVMKVNVLTMMTRTGKLMLQFMRRSSMYEKVEREEERIKVACNLYFTRDVYGE